MDTVLWGHALALLLLGGEKISFPVRAMRAQREAGFPASYTRIPPPSCATTGVHNRKGRRSRSDLYGVVGGQFVRPLARWVCRHWSLCASSNPGFPLRHLYKCERTPVAVNQNYGVTMA